jgi:type I restriction enzyme S subunit
MKAKKYLKYKPSGVEWLGEMPEHWGIKKLKYCCQLITTKTAKREYPVALENIESWTGRFLETESEFEGEGIGFIQNDILFGKLRPYLAKVFQAVRNGEAVGDFFVLRPLKNVEAANQSYILRSREYIEIIDGSTFGAKMPRASWDFMGSLLVPLAPPAEQQSIASFLDRETGRIDALIDKNKRLIDLLKEKRTATISRAVTKGLDLKVKMKPSGVEWLGNVPEHWKVKKLKFVARTITGYAFSSDDYLDEGIPVIRIGDILENGTVDITNAKRLPPEYLNQFRSIRIDHGNMLMAMTGATIGKAGKYLNDESGLLNQRVCKFVGHNICESFMWYVLKSPQYSEHIKLTGFGGAQPNISDVQLLDFYCSIPPEKEQTDIATFLDREIGKLDNLTSNVETAILTLKEYRTALISAAVTGKIDVREAA